MLSSGISTATFSNDDLKREIISACAKIADNPVSYSGFDENGLNREVRNLLDSAISRFGYTVADQTQQGFSNSQSGELDIRINKDGIPVAIYEGLFHRNIQYLYKHIEKAISNYNVSGCKKVYVVEYISGQHFEKWISDVDLLENDRILCVTEEETGILGVKMFHCQYNWNGQTGQLYYIAVNCL